MTPTNHPEVTSGRRELGAMLSLLRQERKHSGNAVALALGWSPSWISRIERGLTSVSGSRLATLLAHYQVGEEVFVRLFELNRLALEQSRVRPMGEPLFLDLCVAGLHEAAATRVTEYEPLAIPALLQTPDYARALLRTTELLTGEAVDRHVAALKQRQDILTRSSPTLRFFISEHALREPVGDKQIMGTQLRRLITIVARHECIIRVLPTSAGPAGIFGGPFRVLEYADSRDVAHTQNRAAHVFQEDPPDVDVYRAILDRLRHLALDTEQSIQVINDLAITYTGVIQPLATSGTNGTAVPIAGQQYD